jgi:hypothetical protein
LSWQLKIEAVDVIEGSQFGCNAPAIGSAKKFGVRYRYCVDFIRKNLWPCKGPDQKSSAAGSARRAVRAEKQEKLLRFLGLVSVRSLSWLGLKILVSVVRFRPRPPNANEINGLRVMRNPFFI